MNRARQSYVKGIRRVPIEATVPRDGPAYPPRCPCCRACTVAGCPWGGPFTGYTVPVPAAELEKPAP